MAEQAAQIRSWRERALQTLAFEAGGLVVVTPLWVLATGSGAAESVLLMVSLVVAVMAWAALFNTLFDLAEARIAGRVASDRPQWLRLVHASALEASSVAVTTPLIVWLTGFGWLEAFVADMSLALAYAVYGYLFHLGFDRLRPVPGGTRAVRRP